MRATIIKERINGLHGVGVQRLLTLSHRSGVFEHLIQSFVVWIRAKNDFLHPLHRAILGFTTNRPLHLLIASF